MTPYFANCRPGLIVEAADLSEMVAAWMKRVLDLRKDRPGTLVAMLDSDRKMSDTAPGIISQLKQVAASGQMDFFEIQAREGRDAGVALIGGQFYAALPRLTIPI